MENVPKHAVSWVTYPHERKLRPDILWILGIVAAGGAIAALLFGNVLFAIVIFLSSLGIGFTALREPSEIQYELNEKGVRISDSYYPWRELTAYHIDEHDLHGPRLLFHTTHFFLHILAMPVPEESIGAIKSFLIDKLKEEHIDEPLGHRLLEFFGF